MSKVKVDTITDLNEQNEVSVERVFEISNKVDYEDWYNTGEILLTTKQLNSEDFLKVDNNVVIDNFLYPDLYNLYSTKNKKISKQNNFIPVDYKTDQNDSILYIQINDFTFFEILQTSQSINQITVNRNGEIVSIFSKDINLAIDPANVSGKITWDTNEIKEEEKIIFYLKIGFNLYFYIYDYNQDIEYIDFVSSFFQNADSAVKITEKYAYELTADTLYRYDLQKTNATPDSTATTVFTSADLDATYTETFSGEADSDFYGFGEDIDIVFFKDQTKDDKVVFSDKEAEHMEFYISTINDTFTTNDIINNAVLISNNPLNNDNNEKLEILNDGSIFENIAPVPILINDKCFISQTSEDKLLIGSLNQFPVYSQIYIQLLSSNSKKVYNAMSFQIIDLNNNSFLAHNVIVNNDFLPTSDSYAFDIIATNDNSISLLYFYEAEENDISTGELYYNQQNTVYNINFNIGSYDETNNVYDDPDNHETYVYKIVDSNNKILNIKRESDKFATAYNDYFYQLKNSQAAIRSADDRQYSTIVEGLNNNLIMMTTLDGYFIKELSNEENTNTYIKR